MNKIETSRPVFRTDRETFELFETVIGSRLRFVDKDIRQPHMLVPMQLLNIEDWPVLIPEDK